MHAAAVSREMMSFALRSRLALAFVLVCGISCGGAGGDAGGITGPPTVTPTAAQVTLAPSSIALTVGASRTLTAEVRNTLGAVLVGQSIVWTASDTAVLSVNGGTVTARKAGTASVIASVGSVQGSAPVTVTPTCS
jgi:alpha-amylase